MIFQDLVIISPNHKSSKPESPDLFITLSPLSSLSMHLSLSSLCDKTIIEWFSKYTLNNIFARICNINLAAYGRSVDIANSRKILLNVYFEIIQ